MYRGKKRPRRIDKEANKLYLSKSISEHVNNSTTLSSTLATTRMVDLPSESVQQKSLTTAAKVGLLIDQDRVKFAPQSEVFNVHSFDDKSIYCIHMRDPKRLFKCSCSNMQRSCSHITAAKVALGAYVNEKPTKVNMEQERKRKNKEDKIGVEGKKRPRRTVKKQIKFIYQNQSPSTSQHCLRH
ncbi:unnamed protein product [Didymodactylos carnosus]|uniref:SWIM-type domain-containing protein n=1 Tax=Didymodactylos carnosus TaxID=1234261 RepID=A0A814NV55_9BILA|nr:unnamed protein product [Didymodactylos carnosus]CAF1159779.1 unnamed protein product [Didymodactylos carnosus]CAF3862886.1 unnamed protein product [Didymodactylos carnosus]CAF3971421.1 unnamed protein product [Didymodactylos carnosus]